MNYDESKIQELIEAARLYVDVDGPDRTWQERRFTHERIGRALEAIDALRKKPSTAIARLVAKTGELKDRTEAIRLKDQQREDSARKFFFCRAWEAIRDSIAIH